MAAWFFLGSHPRNALKARELCASCLGYTSWRPAEHSEPIAHGFEQSIHVLETVCNGPGEIPWMKMAAKKRKDCERSRSRRVIPWLSSVEKTDSAPTARCQTSSKRPRTGSATLGDVTRGALLPRASPMSKMCG